MKFLYEYRTSENKRMVGAISAPNKDAVFQALKEKGVRPSKVYEAPGFFNKLFGKYKRWLVIALLLLVIAGMVAREILVDSSDEAVADVQPETSPKVVDVQVAQEQLYSEGRFARPIERRQIWGDEAVIDMAAQSNWKVIFPNPADRFLSLFAQPGFMLPVFPRVPATIKDDFARALEERFTVSETDLDEYKQMKCIVEGMKVELREYLAEGGSLDGYIRRLVARQKEEADFVKKAKERLDAQIKSGVDAFDAWKDMNKVLRDQGLKTIPMPLQPE